MESRRTSPRQRSVMVARVAGLEYGGCRECTACTSQLIAN